MSVDKPKELKLQSEALQKQIVVLQKRVFELAQEEFNLNSPKQLQEVLFERMEIQKDLKVKLRPDKNRLLYRRGYAGSFAGSPHCRRDSSLSPFI